MVCTGSHVVAGGPHRLSVMAGQDVGHLGKVAGCTGRIRSGGQSHEHVHCVGAIPWQSRSFLPSAGNPRQI